MQAQTFTDQHPRAGSRRLSLVVLLLGALMMALLPSSGVPAALADGHDFDDLSQDNPHRDNVLRLSADGVIRGFGDGTFRPFRAVTRGQFATYLAGVAGLEQASGPYDFPDIEGSVHAGNIQALYEAGVISGFGDGTYRPSASISRAQTASVLAGWLDVEGIAEGPFEDVSADSVHAPNINALYDLGIVNGTTPTTYAPRGTLQRDQAASLVVAASDVRDATPTTHDLTLLATTEVHTHLRAWDYYNDEPDESLGLAKTYSLIQEARAQHDNTLLFDTGDILQGAFLGEYVALIDPLEPDDVHPAIAAMNLMDYDALTLGNHEFDFGLDFLDQVLGDANFPSISANVFEVDEDGEMTDPLVDPYVIVDAEVDGEALSVGVIGITPPGIMTWHSESLAGSVDTIPAIEALDRYLPELEDEGVDLTVLSAHAGKRLELGPDAQINPEGENWLWFAAEQFQDELDAIVFGHEQSVFPGDSKYDGVEGLDNERGLIHGVPSVMAGAFGNHLGKLHLELSHDRGEWSVTDGWAENVPVTEETEEAQEIVDAVAVHHDATVDYVRSPVGETELAITHYFSRVMDTKAVEIINDSQKWWAEDHLDGTQYEDLPVLSAAAPFRAGRTGPDEFTYIPAGPVSVRELADLYIYPNQIRVVQLDGGQVIDWLEASAENFRRIDPGEAEDQPLIDESFEPFNFDVIDGIEYEVDVTQPVGERIVNATFEGEPLTADTEFAVVTNDYRAGGGGGFPHLDGTNTIVSSDETNRSVLVSYVTETSPVTEPADENWSILPVDVEGTVYFRSSPDAADHIEDVGLTGVSYLETDTEGWGIFEYHFE